MRVKMTFAVLAMATLALALPASSTAHRTVTVHSGESIQAAIDAAKPGTTIKVEEGTYAEALTIDKDGIELVGEDGRRRISSRPPARPPTACSRPQESASPTPLTPTTEYGTSRSATCR